MQCYKINSIDYQKVFEELGTEKAGAVILAKKASYNCLYIKDLHTGAANILKQDALSIGADLAVPRGTIVNKTPTVDAILIGTNKHFEVLSKKELSQPFGLKELSKQLKSFVKLKKYEPRIMGIINANDDSFYSSSRFLGKNAIDKINDMIKQGASIIDIGAVSSKPGSKAVSEALELSRIKDICDEIKEKKLYDKVVFSIDSYTPTVVEYALKSGFKIVNDITGLDNAEIANLVSAYDASIVIMHMQNTPKDMQDAPSYDNVILEIDDFFKQRIKKALDFGIKNIILDIGIGFGKTLEHNIELLKNLESFRHFGYEILIGASRKSMINTISPSDTKDRLPGSLAIHLDALSKGASIVRCHDVYEHNQAIKVYTQLNH